MSKTIQVKNNSIALFRIFLSSIFVVASIEHLANVEKVVHRINQARLKELGYLLGNPEVSVIASGIVMLVAGTALLTGFKTRYAAMLLAAVLIPITITIQVGQMATIGPLFKNIAIFGGLLFFIMNDLEKQKK